MSDPPPSLSRRLAPEPALAILAAGLHDGTVNNRSAKPRMSWQAARAASAGYFIIIALLLGAGGGYLVDERLGTQPYGILVGFAVGLIAAGRELYSIAKTTRLSDPPGK